MVEIDCEINPKELVEQIGDPFFWICDDLCAQVYPHPNHPETLRIRDAEDNLTIDVTGESIQDTREIAEALCSLLNQDYGVI